MGPRESTRLRTTGAGPRPIVLVISTTGTDRYNVTLMLPSIVDTLTTFFTV